jgi:4-alpha-glucanotransferase
VRFPRSSGILLHPTSLPGRFGIGDLGQGAYHFIDFLERTGQRVWQVLPLGQTGYGDSPYQCFSAYAGNPLLVSLERLVQDGLLNEDDLASPKAFPADHVDFGAVIQFKREALEIAGNRFRESDSHPDRPAFDAFCKQEIHWLSDYTLFMAMKQCHDWKPWNQWDKGIATRSEDALRHWGETLADPIFVLKFTQFQFFKQWREIKSYANARGIRIMGDIPIYVAHDSADVWSHPDLYHLDDDGNPTVVAGVPPDYFSATGQLWGNPIYRWDVMEQRGFHWWAERMRATLRLVDIVRIDHFRGFEAFWRVPATEKTAENGHWVPGPSDSLFHALANALGELPIVAENLGLITDEVENLRHRHDFPGMAVLQFAFGKDAAHSGLLPHQWEHNTVAYTGTADNDTTAGWWKSTGASTESKADIKAARAYAKKYLNTSGKDIHWVCIRALMASVADTVIFPLQDIMGLGTEARMNLPGSSGGKNWCWRYTEDQLTEAMEQQLRELTEIYGRLPGHASQ